MNLGMMLASLNVMTTSATADSAVTIPVRLDFDSRAAAFAKAMGHLDRTATRELDRVDFDPRLRELVRIRASQLNGCAYCIDMHTKDARAAGESEQRLYGLPAWRETPYFTARERAALAFTEAVTMLAALLSLIVTINAWNTIAVTTRAWVPGSYQTEIA